MSLTYVAAFVIGYQVMMAVMSFNVGISLAVFAGVFVGHFIFFSPSLFGRFKSDEGPLDVDKAKGNDYGGTVIKTQIDVPQGSCCKHVD